MRKRKHKTKPHPRRATQQQQEREMERLEILSYELVAAGVQVLRDHFNFTEQQRRSFVKLLLDTAKANRAEALATVEASQRLAKAREQVETSIAALPNGSPSFVVEE